MTKLGFLYPGKAAEDDYPRLAARLDSPTQLELVHTEMAEDAHRTDALLVIGGPGPLLAGAAQLEGCGVDAVVWACTSGSFVFGWDGAWTQVTELAAATGVPASSTSWGFVEATRALGVRNVAVAATYPDDVALRFEEFLARGKIDVVTRTAQDILTAAEVGTVDRDRVLAFVRAGDDPRAEAILVPDTALHTVDIVSELEADRGKPVLTANQVSVWEGLRIAGALAPQKGLGRLFETS